jgi:hypothetical protein
MGTYADVSDIEGAVSKDLLIQMTDDEGNGQINTPIVSAAIRRSEGIVNAALAEASYTIPVATPLVSGTEIIFGATVWLAICDVSSRRGIIPEDYRFWCDFYTARLDALARGELNLPLPTADINDPRSTTLGQAKIFTRTKTDNAGTVRNPDEAGSLDVV